MPPKQKVLVVDDEASMRDACRQILERADMAVVEAENADRASELMRTQNFDLVVLDLKMPGTSGMAFLRSTKEANDPTPVVVITGYGTVESAVEAIKLGACDFLLKPFTPDTFRLAVQKSLQTASLIRQNQRLRSQISSMKDPVVMIGQTPEMKSIFDLITRVGPTDSTALIMGESGTGKELVARALHQHSRRKDGPFVVVDCGALVGALFESELFGHVEGSFTGAIRTVPGRFELADAGTLFIDEVGSIEPAIQVKLLRLLQEREFTPVGSRRTVSVDVRIIAATNSNLFEAVTKGAFREDLYYRLSVVPIVLPPLRQRCDDIPLLAEHFLRRYCRERAKHRERISPEAMEILKSQDWPGNVRELSNIIERAVVLSEGDEIVPTDLLSYSLPPLPRNRAKRVPARDMPTLAEIERDYVERVLRKANGNKARAAGILGINRKTLWRKLKRYGHSAPAAEA